MNLRVETIVEACQAAHIGGYVIEPSIIDIEVMDGVWSTEATYISPLCALVLGQNASTKDFGEQVGDILSVPKEYSEFFHNTLVGRMWRVRGGIRLRDFGFSLTRNRAVFDAYDVYDQLYHQKILLSRFYSIAPRKNFQE